MACEYCGRAGRNHGDHSCDGCGAPTGPDYPEVKYQQDGMHMTGNLFVPGVYSGKLVEKCFGGVVAPWGVWKIVR